MILFVDDEPHHVNSYVKDLELEGYKVQVVKTVDGALEVLRDYRDKIELAILDIMMSPGRAFEDVDTKLGTRTGVVLFPRLRAMAPHIPVIILTNVRDDAVESRFGREPRCEFRQKDNLLPYELTDLVAGFLGEAGRIEERGQTGGGRE